MCNIVVFVGEKVLEGFFELLEVHEMVHFELEEPEEDFSKLDYGGDCLLCLVELDKGADGIGDDAVS